MADSGCNLTDLLPTTKTFSIKELKVRAARDKQAQMKSLKEHHIPHYAHSLPIDDTETADGVVAVEHSALPATRTVNIAQISKLTAMPRGADSSHTNVAAIEPQLTSHHVSHHVPQSVYQQEPVQVTAPAPHQTALSAVPEWLPPQDEVFNLPLPEIGNSDDLDAYEAELRAEFAPPPVLATAAPVSPIPASASASAQVPNDAPVLTSMPKSMLKPETKADPAATQTSASVKKQTAADHSAATALADFDSEFADLRAVLNEFRHSHPQQAVVTSAAATTTATATATTTNTRAVIVERDYKVNPSELRAQAQVFIDNDDLAPWEPRSVVFFALTNSGYVEKEQELSGTWESRAVAAAAAAADKQSQSLLEPQVMGSQERYELMIDELRAGLQKHLRPFVLQLDDLDSSNRNIQVCSIFAPKTGESFKLSFFVDSKYHVTTVQCSSNSDVAQQCLRFFQHVKGCFIYELSERLDAFKAGTGSSPRASRTPSSSSTQGTGSKIPWRERSAATKGSTEAAPMPRLSGSPRDNKLLRRNNNLQLERAEVASKMVVGGKVTAQSKASVGKARLISLEERVVNALRPLGVVVVSVCDKNFQKQFVLQGSLGEFKVSVYYNAKNTISSITISQRNDESFRCLRVLEGSLIGSPLEVAVDVKRTVSGTGTGTGASGGRKSRGRASSALGAGAVTARAASARAASARATSARGGTGIRGGRK